MDDEKRRMTAAALAMIGQAQAQIMHGLTFLAMECGEELLPSIRPSVDMYAEWIQTQHRVIVEAERFVPPTVVVVPPINYDVL